MKSLEHPNRIVLWGMSCAGKTTFAKTFVDYHYCCFDELFAWHTIETLGLSIDTALMSVKEECEKHPKFVLDGWHLGDREGLLLPKNSVVYVVYASYDAIISQYRVPVDDPEQHRHMFRQWYDISFEASYFLNDGEFKLTSREEFMALTVPCR